MTYKPMTEIEWRDLNRTDSFVWPTAHSGWWREQAIEQAVLARIESQGLVIVPREFLAWMPDGIDDSMPVTLYAQQLNKGGA